MDSLFKTIFLILFLISSNTATVQAAIRSYNIEGIFFEPAAYDTVFTGTFDWDDATDTLSNLMGVMNSGMVTTDQNLNLSHHLATTIDQNGMVTASVFKENTIDVFMYGGYQKGAAFKYGITFDPEYQGDLTPNENAYFSFSFDKATMLADVNSIVYADCTPDGLMGAIVCMTGSTLVGSMNAVPLSLSISEVSAVPVPAAAWLCGGALMSLLAANRRKNVLPA